MLVAALALVGAAVAAVAPPAEDPAPSAGGPADRLGWFHLGPFYVTPSFRIGPVGLDTNVFYTPTARRTDLLGTAGPALEVVLPFGPSARLVADGSLGYLYFLRTPTERKLTGGGRGRLEWKTSRWLAAVSESYQRSYSRPSFEVDDRILEDYEASQAELRRRLFGRTTLKLAAGRARIETEGTYLGADLRTHLSRDEYRASGGLDYALTIKTSVVAEAQVQRDRFLFDTGRDGDSARLLAGLRTDATALIAGRALVGVRSFRFRRSGARTWGLMVADVDATMSLGAKTRLGGSYARDLGYSAFDPSGPTPTVLIESAAARIERELPGHLELRLSWTESRLATNGAVTLELAGGLRVTAVRDDRVHQGAAELAYRRGRWRIGANALYTQRQSPIRDFGIAGLVLGGSIYLNP